MPPEADPNPNPTTQITPPPSPPPPSTPSDPPKPGDQPPSLVNQPVPLALADIKFPDGVEKDDTALGKFVEIMNNKDLSGAARAQALIDLQLDVVKSASEKGSQLFATQQEAWVKEARDDPEIGGDKLDTNLANISKLIDAFGTPTVREVLDSTGSGNHPEMIRFLSKVAKLATESNLLPGGLPPATAKSQAERIFPSMKP